MEVVGHDMDNGFELQEGVPMSYRPMEVDSDVQLMDMEVDSYVQPMDMEPMSPPQEGQYATNETATPDAGHAQLKIEVLFDSLTA